MDNLTTTLDACIKAMVSAELDILSAQKVYQSSSDSHVNGIFETVILSEKEIDGLAYKISGRLCQMLNFDYDFAASGLITAIPGFGTQLPRGNSYRDVFYDHIKGMLKNAKIVIKHETPDAPAYFDARYDAIAV